jgi:hypothetical protein
VCTFGGGWKQSPQRQSMAGSFLPWSKDGNGSTSLTLKSHPVHPETLAHK